MIHDLTPEGTFSIVKQDDTTQGWFPGFPYAHPDPTLPAVVFNTQLEKFQDKRVRWALALMLDAQAMSLASYRGAATFSALQVPPTGLHPDDYHEPMQDWQMAYTIEAGGKTFQPYDPEITLRIAETVRRQFDGVPEDEEAIRRSFGYGWWAQNLEAATLLLEDAGFEKRGDAWYMPNGERFAVELGYSAEGVMSRLGSIIVQQWIQAGVHATSRTDPQMWDQMFNGDFETHIGWSVETRGGHPDLSFFLDSWHSEFVAEPGARQSARNWQRWSHPELDRIIKEMGLVSGYVGGAVDRVLMVVNDVFVTLPLLPVLLVFYFVLGDSLNTIDLALLMACLGWPFDARLIRSIALGLRHREFTRHAAFSGMSPLKIMFEEHLPYVMPVVFATAMANMLWAIGVEVTLAVLGFTNINLATVGTTILLGQQPLGHGGGHLVVDRHPGGAGRGPVHRPPVQASARATSAACSGMLKVPSRLLRYSLLGLWPPARNRSTQPSLS